MARRDDGEQAGKGLPQAAVRIDDDRFLSGMRGRRRDDRPLAHYRADRGELAGIDWRGRHVELQVAGHADARRAELRVTLGVGLGLRETEVEARQERADRVRQIAPACERALGEASVDQDQRNIPLRAGEDQVRPQIGFREQREIGTPVLEEAGRIARRVERDELMDGAFRQSPVGKPRRGHGARRDQNIEIARAHSLDKRNHRQHFADACAMGPDQRSWRARDRAFAAPLGQPLRMLLAAAQASRQHKTRQGRRHRGEALIGAQRPWQPFSHARYLRSDCRRSHKPARSPRSDCLRPAAGIAPAHRCQRQPAPTPARRTQPRHG